MNCVLNDIYGLRWVHRSKALNPRTRPFVSSRLLILQTNILLLNKLWLYLLLLIKVNVGTQNTSSIQIDQLALYRGIYNLSLTSVFTAIQSIYKLLLLNHILIAATL